ncbi:MAG: hypothetical protein HXY34_04325 [Candidatus Thorarchaeota archaeon]|nr:hypothetical protein [Candidatus Thorarchaeota archaeon]
MTRTPIEVYRGILNTRFHSEASSQIGHLVSKFSSSSYAGRRLSDHLSRFLALLTRLIAYLNNRTTSSPSDLTQAIDVLDYFASTSKWWTPNRENPGFVLRPASQDARDFLSSISSIELGAATLDRVRAATDRLSSFLAEHNFALSGDAGRLRDDIASSWMLLSGLSCRGQGRTMTTETDFETAYDLVRILLFHMMPEDFGSLTAVREIGTSTSLIRAARVQLAPGFDRNLDSSAAARLESVYAEEFLSDISSLQSVFRHLLTNSLRILVQIQAARVGLSEIGSDEYESFIVGALSMLQLAGVPAETLQYEHSIPSLYRRIRPSPEMIEQTRSIGRKIEGLILETAGNRDFLVRNPHLVPRVLSLLLLVSAGTKQPTSEDGLQESDLKRGLILLSQVISG